MGEGFFSAMMVVLFLLLYFLMLVGVDVGRGDDSERERRPGRQQRRADVQLRVVAPHRTSRSSSIARYLSIWDFANTSISTRPKYNRYFDKDQE
jgi:hypothetical protein